MQNYPRDVDVRFVHQSLAHNFAQTFGETSVQNYARDFDAQTFRETSMQNYPRDVDVKLFARL